MSDYERLSDDRLAELRSDCEAGFPLHPDDFDALLSEVERTRVAQPCGHEGRFVVSGDEGTSFCAMCEMDGHAKRHKDLQDRIAEARVAMVTYDGPRDQKTADQIVGAFDAVMGNSYVT